MGYQYLDSQSSQLHMPRRQCKSMNIKSQENVPPPEASIPTTVGPEKCAIAEAQGEDFQISIMSKIKDHKEDVNESLESEFR